RARTHLRHLRNLRSATLIPRTHCNSGPDPRPAPRDPRPASRAPRPAPRAPRLATRDPRPATRDPRQAPRPAPVAAFTVSPPPCYFRLPRPEPRTRGIDGHRSSDFPVHRRGFPRPRLAPVRGRARRARYGAHLGG